jgi:hypothetical protein
MMKTFVAIILFFTSGFLSAQKIGSDLDSTINTLIASGMKKFEDVKGDSTSIMSDSFFKQYNSKIVLGGFKYSLITHYPAGKLWFFTGLFNQTYNFKKALQSYTLLANRIEKVKITCCTLKREPGTDLEHEKTTYYKPFARPKEYANLQMIVALENVKQTNGKLKYNVLLYIYSNPK